MAKRSTFKRIRNVTKNNYVRRIKDMIRSQRREAEGRWAGVGDKGAKFNNIVEGAHG